MCISLLIFFFKQKTAYEVRISDWSSDVCSSDLNIARSFGPAIGGLVVVAIGAKGAFGINALFYLPLLLMFFLWQRQHVTSRLSPERLNRAIISGARYDLHSSPIRTVLIRAALFGLCSAATAPLPVLMARAMLHGNASTRSEEHTSDLQYLMRISYAV